MKMQCWNFIWWSTRSVWLVKTFGFIRFGEGIGSTHRGILGTYTTISGINNTSSIVEYAGESRGYNLPKALCDRGKAHKLIEYEGCCRINSNKGSGGPQGIWCEHRYSTRRRKNARRSDYSSNWLIQSSNVTELRFPNKGIRSRGFNKRQVE